MSSGDIVDAAERQLDDSGLERPHLVGNSMGGFIAIELARRGRASSVCAFSPGGFWSGDLRATTVNDIRRTVRIARRTRFVTPLLMRSPAVRRRAMRDAAVRGDLMSRARAVEIAAEPLDCTVVDDIVGSDERVAPLDPLPCPVTIAWGELDTVLPVRSYEAVVRERLPAAEFVVLPGVGHVPMLDDPDLVARTIVATTEAH